MVENPPQEKQYKKWSECSDEERTEVLWELMRAGHTNKTAAKELKTTPGSVAGWRNRHNIPSRDNFPKEKKGIETPASTAHKPRGKLAASEATQCIHKDNDGRRCAYERLPRSRFCALHQP